MSAGKLSSTAPQLERTVLSNGLVVVTNEDQYTETVAFSGSIRAGAMFDELKQIGTAELVARLLLRGTEAHIGAKLAERIEEMGATLQFFNNDEVVSFSGRCHADYVASLLAIMAECLSEPAFAPVELEKTRGEILSNLEEEKDDTRTSAYRALMALVFGKKQLYGRNPLGVKEELLSLDVEQARSFHQKYYQPSRVILAASGRFQTKTLLQSIEATLGKWEGNPNSSPEKAEPHFAPKEPELQLLPMEHKSQLDLALGARSVARKGKEFYPMNIGNLLLGRIGLYGRLGKNVRDEKGLAYYCFSILQAKSYAGSMAVFAGVNPKNAELAVKEITRELARMASEPLSKEELATARRNLLGALSITLETAAERVGILHDIEYYSLGLDHLQRYPSLLEAVSSEQVLQSFQEYFRPEVISLTAAGPLQALRFRLPRELGTELSAATVA